MQEQAYDAGWETDFEYVVPDDLRSGVYAVRLTADDDEWYVTFFVRPPRGTCGCAQENWLQKSGCKSRVECSPAWADCQDRNRTYSELYSRSLAQSDIRRTEKIWTSR